MRALFQDRGGESEAGFVRGAAGAVVLLRELRRIAGEIEALRKAMKG